MTKKDYIALAAALKAQMPTYAGDVGHMDYAYHCKALAQWREDVCAIMVACREGSARFNPNKFVQACGMPNALRNSGE